jgi:hypothetical protein
LIETIFIRLLSHNPFVLVANVSFLTAILRALALTVRLPELEVTSVMPVASLLIRLS